MKSITLTAAPRELDAAQDFVARCYASAHLPSTLLARVALAVEEVFVNIAYYAYDGQEGKTTIDCWTDDAFHLRFTDSGIPYDPLGREDPDITLSAEDREIGGLGVFLVKNIMDHVEYRRESGQNILEMDLHCGD